MMTTFKKSVVRRIEFLVFLAVLLVGLGSSAVWAQPSTRTFVIGVENIDYYPVQDFRDPGRSTYMKELIDAFCQDYGYTCVYRPMPVSRLMLSFLHGRVDFKLPDSPAWFPEMRRTHDIVYSEPILDYTDVTLVHKDRVGRPVEEVRDLVTVAGFMPYAWHDQIRAGDVQLHGNTDIDALIKQVANARADGAYANADVLNYHLNNLGASADDVRFDANLPQGSGTYHLATMRYPEVIQEFNAWLIDNADEVQSLKEHYEIESLPPGHVHE